MRVTRAIYRLTSDESLSVSANTVFKSTLDFRSSILSGGELYSKEKLRFRPFSGVIEREVAIVKV
jgi:hypothetical protein